MRSSNMYIQDPLCIKIRGGITSKSTEEREVEPACFVKEKLNFCCVWACLQFCVILKSFLFLSIFFFLYYNVYFRTLLFTMTLDNICSI